MAVLASLAIAFQPVGYHRVTPLAYRSTPLGMGFGRSRFSSPDDGFEVLYRAADLATGIAETLIRDRFENRRRRRIGAAEIARWGVTRVRAARPLTVIDLRTTGLLRLGISTDAGRAKVHRDGPRLSRAIHATSDANGILYGSRLTGAACCAVYDRAVATLRAEPVTELLQEASLASVLGSLAVELVISA
ncbi:RES family NAD+ phosphorylase [Methylobacterium sp. J-026]|nr:RES family NAD+ phosphorylase [Methylobacterium sp. J-026]